MKKKFLLLNLSIACLLATATEENVINFENGGASVYSNSGFFGDNGFGQVYGVVANPAKGDSNNSDSVLMIKTAPGMAEWAGTWYSLIDTFQFGVDGGIDTIVKCKVYKTTISNFFVKWEGYDPNTGETFKTPDDFAKPNNTSNAWEEMTFTYTGHKGMVIKTMTIIPDYVSSIEARTDTVYTYVDDVILTKVSSTGIKQHIIIKNFVYPTYVFDFVNISLQNVDEVEIFDINGKLVKVFKNPTQKINISDLAGGLYFIKAFVDNDQYISKIVKR